MGGAGTAHRPLCRGAADRPPAGGSWFLINVTHFVDALDEAKSDIDRSPKGHITGINKHAFIPDVVKQNPIFKIRQDPLDVFISEAFLKVVEREKLTGLIEYRKRRK